MFDVEGARKAGYSDAEIAKHLSAQANFDLAGAKKAGYSDGEVIAELSGRKPQSSAEQLAAINAGAATAQEVAAHIDAARSAPRPQEPTLTDKAIGAGEAALATASGITGVAGGALGIAQGLLDIPLRGKTIQDAEAKRQQYAGALTYTPRTQEGIEQTQALGTALMPLAGHAAELGAIAQGVGPAAGMARTGAAMTLEKARTAVPAAVERLRSVEQATPTPGTLGSVGAAATDMAAQRNALADSFGIPRLTKGQATRDPAQVKFERESAKLPEQGAPLREKYIAQNEAILKQFDRWVDQTGAEAPTLREAGLVVDKAVVQQAARDKAQLNAAYRAADKSPEAQIKVDPGKAVAIGEGADAIESSPLAFINEQPTGLPSTALTDAARQYAVKLGIAELQDGQLVARPDVTIRQMEAWRKAINQATGYEPADVRSATVLKRMIDAQTEPLAGPLYRDARNLRRRYAQNYEDRATISKLLSTKRGTNDRQVAFEDIFEHSVLKGSRDDVANVRRVLQRAGADGHQAWSELQGQTVQWIRDQAAKNIATDSAGNRVISPSGLDKAIRSLDADGRLEVVFGKRGAQRLRDINDLAQYVQTVPPEAAVNMSNTAATLMASFMDVGISGISGIPAPIATSARMITRYVKDAQLRRRILEALGEAEAKQKAKPPTAPAPQEQVLH